MAKVVAPLPALTRKYLKYALAFGVTLAVGLAPLLGALPVPGLSALLSLFPTDLQFVVIPFAAFLMALPPLVAEFAATVGGVSRNARIVTFGCAFVVVLGGSALLFRSYSHDVKRVSSAGGVTAYVVGSKFEPDCPCVKAHLRIEQCIGHEISTQPEMVASCYSDDEIIDRRLTLSGLYIATMLGFGFMIAALILTKPSPGRSRSVRA